MIQTKATITRISALSDGGLSIGLHTQELSTSEKALLMDYAGLLGWFLFKENEFSDGDIPELDVADENKTPSQRLRSVLYIYWQQKKITEEFNVWYRKKMEEIILYFKDKLN